MRTIKFRAWDKNSKQFITHELINGNENPIISICGFVKLEPWQQYTGLLDKNGKEIYEGDIVKNTKHKEQLVEVFWKGSVIRKSDGWIKWGGWYFRTIKKDGQLDYATYSNHIEVIGNIYENPNLLN